MFKGRVAAGRGETTKDVKGIAKGRVWTAPKAKGSGSSTSSALDAALAEARDARQDRCGDRTRDLSARNPTLRKELLVSFGRRGSTGMGVRPSMRRSTGLRESCSPRLAAETASHLIEPDAVVPAHAHPGPHVPAGAPDEEHLLVRFTRRVWRNKRTPNVPPPHLRPGSIPAPAPRS